MLVAGAAGPVPRLDIGLGVCEAIPTLLHEEARPVLASVPSRCVSAGIGGAEVCLLGCHSLLLPYQSTGLCKTGNTAPHERMTNLISVTE